MGAAVPGLGHEEPPRCRSFTPRVGGSSHPGESRARARLRTSLGTPEASCAALMGPNREILKLYSDIAMIPYAYRYARVVHARRQTPKAFPARRHDFSAGSDNARFRRLVSWKKVFSPLLIHPVPRAACGRPSGPEARGFSRRPQSHERAEVAHAVRRVIAAGTSSSCALEKGGESLSSPSLRPFYSPSF